MGGCGGVLLVFAELMHAINRRGIVWSSEVAVRIWSCGHFRGIHVEHRYLGFEGKGLLDDDVSGKVACAVSGAGWFEGVADEWNVHATVRDLCEQRFRQRCWMRISTRSKLGVGSGVCSGVWRTLVVFKSSVS